MLPGLCTVGFWDAQQQQSWGTGWHYNEGLELGFLETGRLTFSLPEATSVLSPGEVSFTRPWLHHNLGNPHVGGHGPTGSCWTWASAAPARPGGGPGGSCSRRPTARNWPRWVRRGACLAGRRAIAAVFPTVGPLDQGRLRAPRLAEALGAQDGLYARRLRDGESVDDVRIIGCLREVVDAQDVNVAGDRRARRPARQGRHADDHREGLLPRAGDRRARRGPSRHRP